MCTVAHLKAIQEDDDEDEPEQISAAARPMTTAVTPESLPPVALGHGNNISDDGKTAASTKHELAHLQD